MELQHFVSKFIVKKWIVKDGKVIQHYVPDYVDKLIHEDIPTKNVLAWPDLYTINLSKNSGPFTRFLEHDATRDLEGRMATLLRKLDKEPYSRFRYIRHPFHQHLIRSFVRLHFIRHPDYIRYALSKYPTDKFKNIMTPDNMKYLGIHMDTTEDVVKYLIGNVILRTDALERLGDAAYLYYTLPPHFPDEFILGDKFIYSLFDKHPNNVPLEINYMKGVSVFPVSPRNAIFIINKPEILNKLYKTSDKRIVHILNVEVTHSSTYALLEPNIRLRSYIEDRFKPSHYFCQASKTFKLRAGFSLQER